MPAAERHPLARWRQGRAYSRSEYSSVLHLCGWRFFVRNSDEYLELIEEIIWRPVVIHESDIAIGSEITTALPEYLFRGNSEISFSIRKLNKSGRAFSSVALNSSFSHFIGQILQRYFLLLFHQKNHMTFHALYPKTKVCDFRSLLHLFFGFKSRESRLMKNEYIYP